MLKGNQNIFGNSIILVPPSSDAKAAGETGSSPKKRKRRRTKKPSQVLLSKSIPIFPSRKNNHRENFEIEKKQEKSPPQLFPKGFDGFLKNEIETKEEKAKQNSNPSRIPNLPPLNLPTEAFLKPHNPLPKSLQKLGNHFEPTRVYRRKPKTARLSTKRGKPSHDVLTTIGNEYLQYKKGFEYEDINTTKPSPSSLLSMSHSASAPEVSEGEGNQANLRIRYISRKRLGLSATGNLELRDETWVALEEEEEREEDAIYAHRHRGRLVLTPLNHLLLSRGCRPGELGGRYSTKLDLSGLPMMPSLARKFENFLEERGTLFETKRLIRDRDKDWRQDSFRAAIQKRPEEKETTGSVVTWDKGRVWVDGHLLTKIIMHKEVCMISNTYCILTVYGMGIHGRVYGEGVNASGHMPRFLTISAYDPRDCGNYEVRVEMDELKRLFSNNADLLIAGHKFELIRALIRMLKFDYGTEVEQEVCRLQDRIDFIVMSLDPEKRRRVKKRLDVATTDLEEAQGLLDHMIMNGGPARIKTAGMRVDDCEKKLTHATKEYDEIMEAGTVDNFRRTRKELRIMLRKEKELWEGKLQVSLYETQKILILSPGVKKNRTQRRLERARRLLEYRKLGVYPPTPRAKDDPPHRKHRIYCEARRLRGWKCILYVQIFVYPRRKNNFMIRAYDPKKSKTFEIKVGKWEAMELVKDDVWTYPEVAVPPSEWDKETEKRVAKYLIRKLYIRTWDKGGVLQDGTRCHEGTTVLGLAHRYGVAGGGLDFHDEVHSNPEQTRTNDSHSVDSSKRKKRDALKYYTDIQKAMVYKRPAQGMIRNRYRGTRIARGTAALRMQANVRSIHYESVVFSLYKIPTPAYPIYELDIFCAKSCHHVVVNFQGLNFDAIVKCFDSNFDSKDGETRCKAPEAEGMTPSPKRVFHKEQIFGSYFVVQHNDVSRSRQLRGSNVKQRTAVCRSIVEQKLSLVGSKSRHQGKVTCSSLAPPVFSELMNMAIDHCFYRKIRKIPIRTGKIGSNSLKIGDGRFLTSVFQKGMSIWFECYNQLTHKVYRPELSKGLQMQLVEELYAIPHSERVATMEVQLEQLIYRKELDVVNFEVIDILSSLREPEKEDESDEEGEIQIIND
eukprot:g631.t1